MTMRRTATVNMDALCKWADGSTTGYSASVILFIFPVASPSIIQLQKQV